LVFSLLRKKGLSCFFHQFVDEDKYDEAVAVLIQILHIKEHAKSHTVKVAARMLAEILCVDKTQNVRAIELLCFSRVIPRDWLGSMGVASKMLKQDRSRIGDLVLDLGEERGPMMIQSDTWCMACNATESTQACKGCGKVYYCCVEHQKNDWPLHKIDCKRDEYKNVYLWNSTHFYQDELNRINEAVEQALQSRERK
jgi:hypothetical protein